MERLPLNIEFEEANESFVNDDFFWDELFDFSVLQDKFDQAKASPEDYPTTNGKVSFGFLNPDESGYNYYIRFDI